MAQCASAFRSFALFIARLMSWWHYRTGFGIALVKHCNLVFCSFVLRIDWLKLFLTDHAITCGVNGLNSFMCLWCNTTIVTIGRKMRFHHTLPFVTKQRCSSVAVTSRQHQKFGIIDTSVATSDILTWHQMWCSQINVWCFGDKSDVAWGVVFFRVSSHFRTKIS